jgi:hypothetical protein
MKIYVHHHYTYELFWYFFHGSNPNELIPTWLGENRYNKDILITETVRINANYKGIDIECIFCNDTFWDKKDGQHVWDYTLYHYQNKRISDRGWNLILGEDLESNIIPMLNKYSKTTNNNLSVFFIDWEFGDTELTNNLNKLLSTDIILFKDELTDIINKQKVSFTHILWSFIYPNTINMRDYYFFADYLKYKNDYKYKLNYPIRRITTLKNYVAQCILEKNNSNLNITLSSFTKYFKNEHRNSDSKYSIYKKLNERIGDNNIIKKRGYNLDDWGGEWNDNNMKEFMWKLLTISDVNLIHEESQGWSINEKSFMHILANKPFVPTHAGTFKFYNEILKSYNIPTKLDKFENKTLKEKVNYLDMISNDNKKWDIFVDELQETVNYYRTELLNIMHNNNGYLDNILFNNDKKSLL